MFETGEYDKENGSEHGLFKHLFEYTVRKDVKLAEILPSINRNAHYKSPEMQNDVISTLFAMVQEDIVADIKSADTPR